MECANCGNLGHSFRDCSEPVLSFGVCAIKIIENEPYYLLIRRRDSLSYVEFLRGKYDLDNSAYIASLLNNMTLEERERLSSDRFDRLWSILWNGQNTRQYRNEYERAKRMFEILKNAGDTYGKLLHKYLEEATGTWTEPEWGFPKGRRTLRESPKKCALREFEEETGMRQDIVHLVEDEPPQVEEYLGTNGTQYKQTYFIGCCAHDTNAILQIHNRVMNREVGGIGWLSFDQAYLKIRSTNGEKRAALGRIHHRITVEGLKDRLLSALEWTSAT